MLESFKEWYLNQMDSIENTLSIIVSLGAIIGFIIACIKKWWHRKPEPEPIPPEPYYKQSNGTPKYHPSNSSPKKRASKENIIIAIILALVFVGCIIFFIYLKNYIDTANISNISNTNSGANTQSTMSDDDTQTESIIYEKPKGVYNNATCSYLDTSASYTVGDHLLFGGYEQDADDSNGKEKIEWRIIYKNNDGLFLISEYLLDTVSYNNEKIGVTWKESTLRKWLNEYFYNVAFSEDEKKTIREITIRNHNNYEYDIEGGDDTIDKVFLLSEEEVKQYLSDSTSWKNGFTIYADRVAIPTVFAKENRCSVHNDGTSPWWLRSPGSRSYQAAFIRSSGFFDSGNVNSVKICVRPVIFVRTSQ